MAEPEQTQFQRARAEFEEWIARTVGDHWPRSKVRYQSRARNGTHHWQITAPGVGEFWLATVDDTFDDPGAVDRATGSLEQADWLDRLPGVPTHGILVKPGGRVFRWDPNRDDAFGYLA